MAGKLSFAQERALIALYRGDEAAIDARSLRGLRVRGLVCAEPDADGNPTLTLRGLQEGKLVEIEAAQRDFTRRMGGSRFFIGELQ